MKKLPLIWLILLLSLSTQIFGATPNMDSLKLVLQNEPKDSFKIEILKEIGDEYFDIDFDSCLHYYQLILQACKKSPYYNMELSTIRSLGWVHSVQNNNYDKALDYFHQALDYADTENDSLGMAYMLSDIGRIYWKKGVSYKALEYHLRVDELGKKLNHAYIILRANLSLGVIENENGDNEKAKRHYQVALTIADSMGRDRTKALVLNNLGKAYQDDQYFLISTQYFEQADSIFSLLEDNDRLGLTQYNLGRNCLLNNNPRGSISFFMDALKYSRQVQNLDQEVMIKADLAKAYQKLKQGKKAISTAKDALNILKELETQLYYDELYLTLAECYELMGDDSNTGLFYKKYLVVRDSLEKDELSNKLTALKHQNEIQKKENQILALKTQELEKEKDLNKSKSKFRIMLLVSILSFLVFVLLYYLNIWNSYRKMEKLKTILSSDLHDNIGSSLNHIKMLSGRLNRPTLKEEDKLSTIHKIKNISNELMYDMHDMVWSLDTSKETIINLIERMQDHADNTLGEFGVPYHFDISLDKKESRLQTREKLNIYLICKEAINNILKHTQSSKVEITFHKSAKRYFKMKISNYYTQLKEGDKSSNHKGLHNMKARAKEIGGHLIVLKEEGIFTIEFEI